MNESRERFARLELFITKEQRNAVIADADRRYPHLRGSTPRNRRNISPTIRDILDFWIAHPALFLTWIATRRDLSSHEQEPRP